MIAPEVIYDKLSSMQADEIAEYLESRGVVGRVEAGNTCAISMYFKNESGLDMFVGYDGIFEYDIEAQTTYYYPAKVDGIQFYTTPDTVQEFMRKFDDGLYPNLIAKDK